MNDIRITYEIEDGYVGGSRPQHMRIDPYDFQELSDNEIVNQLAEQIQDDMLQNTNLIYEETDIVQQIKDALVKVVEAEKEEDK